MSDDIGQRIGAFLDANHVVSLATCGPQGPHAANVFYVRDGFALMWVSDPASRHSIEIEADPRVAGTIAPDYSDFEAVRGVQISGRARRITDAVERANARRLLETRYAFLKQLAEGPPALQQAYARVAFYRLDPARLVLIDNTRGFGHKDALELETI